MLVPVQHAAHKILYGYHLDTVFWEFFMPVDMLIKQMPDDLKAWIAAEARRHHRSMNKESLMLLETVRAPRSAKLR